mmetsp:Transcript_49187/g.96145  ORF Transcript_49187/g.96145 Transcript_49187/m.96145 type:complete len:462 (-) Transcript_49187:1587-2972(-)|eukprot:CAMPEP_0194331696 /NCGR_PEP_ID=MMETSP0171-20130528/56507_1 /TAXON_ID=218684 /ORGANISM="Corethron pennatum, Strain L29A3" /LENGTH=461 /DNA_ID=CAMNT_0039093267 /DNA_START=99 /DNA_END=1484 /DNA_ORIENTATION=-
MRNYLRNPRGSMSKKRSAMTASILPMLIPFASGFVLRSPVATPGAPFAHRAESTAGTGTTPPVRLSPILSEIKPSKTVEVFGMVKQLESEGVSVTSLCVGEPDFDPPQVILDATVEAVTSLGMTRYTAVAGTIELRRAISGDLAKRKGTEYDPVSEIVVSNGAKQSVYQALLATVGPGDEVIVPAPYWPSYPEMVRMTGAEPVVVDTTIDEGYIMSPEALEGAITGKTRVLLLCNPSNPTGAVYSPDALQSLAGVLSRHPDVLVVADEIYERLTYDGAEHRAFASISPEMFQRTLTVNGFSKSHAMTGYRLGYLACPAPYARAVTTLQGQITSCPCGISQHAGVAAITLVDDATMDGIAATMQSKRDYVLERLGAMGGVGLGADPEKSKPRGAFYVLPDVSGFCGGDDVRLCVELLEEEKLALVPGTSFGAPGTVRISYATGLEELGIAMDKLERFLGQRL